MVYSHRNRRRIFKMSIIVLIVAALAAVSAIMLARKYYNDNLRPVSDQHTAMEVTIEPGSTLPTISQLLKDKKLIRSERVFSQYVRNNGAAEDIKAGTYDLSPSYGVSEIVSILTLGKITSKLVTILPGTRIDQVKRSLVSSGFTEDAVNDGLNPQNYSDHPALVDKPKESSLEGYLYPESFNRTSSTTVKEIVEASLDEMQARLTPEVRKSFTSHGLTTHQAVTLASIVEREVSSPEDRQQAAQVFLKRLNIGMKLQSDATSLYGAVLDGTHQDLSPSQILNYNSPYNTYLNQGLPPGPISNVTASSIDAVANPAQTDWLYFVSGDDGKTYFSKTIAEHEALVAQHCHIKCSAQ